jgi:hypothetical protein
MELNPNHPVLTAARENELWPKVAALLVLKLGGYAVISTEEVAEMDGKAVTIKFDDREGIVLSVVSMEEGALLAKKEGGLPH